MSRPLATPFGGRTYPVSGRGDKTSDVSALVIPNRGFRGEQARAAPSYPRIPGVVHRSCESSIAVKYPSSLPSPFYANSLPHLLALIVTLSFDRIFSIGGQTLRRRRHVNLGQTFAFPLLVP